MKLTHFKIVSFIFVTSVLLTLAGCDSSTGTVSDRGIGIVETAPIAVDDNINITVTGIESPVTSLDVLANDSDAENDINKTSIQIVGTTNPGEALIVLGEGNWTVTSTATVGQDPEIKFTPETGFRGDPTPVKYTISDETELVSNEANVIIDYTQTYFENNTTYAIPDGTGIGGTNGVVTSEINVTNAVISIDQVTVTVDITHPWDADVIISLLGPLGNSILLSSTRGSSGDNYTNTTFDDNASISITDSPAAAAPFTGTFIPEEPLSTFVDDNANGTWTLEVSDQGLNDIGTLNAWSITID